MGRLITICFVLCAHGTKCPKIHLLLIVYAQVSDTKDYKKTLHDKLWTLASEKYAVVAQKNHEVDRVSIFVKLQMNIT